MEKYIEELWTSLQGLDKDAQLEMLTEFAEEMYDLGKSDTDEEDDDEELDDDVVDVLSNIDD